MMVPNNTKNATKAKVPTAAATDLGNCVVIFIAPVFWAAHQCAPALFIAFRLLVALLGGRDLLLCAKHLFGAANTVLDGLQLPRRLGNHFKVPVKPGCSQARISADAITAA